MVAAKYILFAFFSTLINLALQWVSLAMYHEFLSLYIAMFFGTLGGLAAKYILDKKYIFYHQSKSKKEDRKMFALYSLMGVLTTFIFWGFEIGFDLLFKSEYAKYIGAILGLGVGYFVKYHLDKRFVFKD